MYPKKNNSWKVETDLLFFDFALFILSQILLWGLYLVLDQIYFRANSKIKESLLQTDVLNFKCIPVSRERSNKSKIKNCPLLFFASPSLKFINSDVRVGE